MLLQTWKCAKDLLSTNKSQTYTGFLTCLCREHDNDYLDHSPAVTLVILDTTGSASFAFALIDFEDTLCCCLILTLDLVALTKSSSDDEPLSSLKLSDSEPLEQASCCRSSSLRLITCSIAGVSGYEYGDSTGLLQRLLRDTPQAW